VLIGVSAVFVVVVVVGVIVVVVTLKKRNRDVALLSIQSERRQPLT
jgi:hypothetical protein